MLTLQDLLNSQGQRLGKYNFRSAIISPHKFGRLIVFLFLALFVALPARSDTLSFRCSFSDGVTSTFSSGTISTKRGSQMTDDLVFDQINVANGTGRVIGNAGAEDVRVFQGSNSIHVIEYTRTRNLIVTTIYLQVDQARAALPAVHSRHNHLTSAIPSQSVGYCRVI
jgi:hypothetical protein